MMKNKFEESLIGLRKVSIAPEKKEAILNSLNRYAEKHPVMAREAFYVVFFKMLRSFVAVKASK